MVRPLLTSPVQDWLARLEQRSTILEKNHYFLFYHPFSFQPGKQMKRALLFSNNNSFEEENNFTAGMCFFFYTKFKPSDQKYHQRDLFIAVQFAICLLNRERRPGTSWVNCQFIEQRRTNNSTHTHSHLRTFIIIIKTAIQYRNKL